MIPSACFCPWCGAINQVTFPSCYRCDLPVFENATSQSRADRPYRAYRLLKGRYCIQRCICIGGASVVYEACDRLLHRRVLLAEGRFTSGPQAQQLEEFNRFLLEVALLTRMVHPQMPQIDDLFVEHGEWYLVIGWKSHSHL